MKKLKGARPPEEEWIQKLPPVRKPGSTYWQEGSGPATFLGRFGVRSRNQSVTSRETRQIAPIPNRRAKATVDGDHKLGYRVRPPLTAPRKSSGA